MLAKLQIITKVKVSFRGKKLATFINPYNILYMV